MYVNAIDNGSNEIRGGEVEKDVGGDEKQVIKCLPGLIKVLYENQHSYKSKADKHRDVLIV